MSGLASGWRSAAIGGFRSLPPRWRERVKQALGALGHAPGWAQGLRARELAAGTKRLDRWAPEAARLLASAGITSLDGCACLEFGSGHLLTEPLIYHLLGAARTVAADRFPILDEAVVGAACEGVDEEALVAALSPFAPEAAIRRRWRALRARSDWSLAALAELGISYRAPCDAAAGPLEPDAFDVIVSCSVLEHVPAGCTAPILASLAASLRPAPSLTDGAAGSLSPGGTGEGGGATPPGRAPSPQEAGRAEATSPARERDRASRRRTPARAGGIMVHAIHLEDHRDFVAAPFAFLAADTDWRPADADRRGNRLRASEWRSRLDAAPGLEVFADEREVRHAVLPELDPAFAGFAPDDLRTKRQVLAARRVA